MTYLLAKLLMKPVESSNHWIQNTRRLLFKTRKISINKINGYPVTLSLKMGDTRLLGLGNQIVSVYLIILMLL